MKYQDNFFKSYISHSFFAVLAVLIAVWPFPGTIAIRHLSLLIALILGLYISNKRLKSYLPAWPVLFLGFLFLWVLIHFFFYARNPSMEYAQLVSSWVRIFVSALLGIVFAVTIRENKYSSIQANLWLYVFLAFMVMPCMIILFNWNVLLNWSGVLELEFWQKPYGDKHSIVFYGVLMIAACLATLQHFGVTYKKLFTFIASISILIFLSIFLLANTKNGFGVFAFQLLSFMTVFIFLRKVNRKILIGCVLVVIVLVPMVSNHVSRNASWKQLIPDIQIGYQIERYPHWQRYDYGYPLNKYHQEVSATNYERTAWGVAGLTLLLEHPMGYGIIKQSFGYLALEKWPNIDPVKVKSTHSGWIDFALALGIPGIFLVFSSFLFSLRAAWGNRKQYWGILSLWVLPTTIFVWLVAELCTNHFVEMLFLILGFFAVINSKPEKNELPMGKN